MNRRISYGILAVLVLGLTTATGQFVILSEDFNNPWSTINPPTGWQIHYTGSPEASDWHRGPDLGPHPWTQNPTPYALLYSSPIKNVSDTLMTPILDCRGYTAVTLRCSTFLANTGSPYQAGIVGSADGGLSWPFAVRSYLPSESVPAQLEVLPLAWALNQAQVRLAWVLVGNTASIRHWAADNVSVIGEAPTADVAPLRIVAPVGTLDSGTAVFPKSWIRNLGNQPATCNVRFRIGATYENWTVMSDLAPGDSQLLEFPLWTASMCGTLPVQCSTALVGDAHPENDAKNDSVTVTLHDAGVFSLDFPRDSADSGFALTPQATVMNYGSAAASFPVIMTIASSYADTQQVLNLGPGEHWVVTFRDWTPGPRGDFFARCSTELAGDVNPYNDLAVNRIQGQVTDIAILRILSPVGIMPESSGATPSILLANYGCTQPLFALVVIVTLGPDTVYRDSVFPAAQTPGRVDTVRFAPWFVARSGQYRVTARAPLSRDGNQANNTATAMLLVGARDVAVTEIWEPRPRTTAGLIQPRARVENYGFTPESFRVIFRISGQIGTAYWDSTDVSGLGGNQTATVYLPMWDAPVGRYLVKCSTALGQDWNPDNDACWDSVQVDSIQAGWSELAPMPAGISNKNVKGGGALCYVPDSTIYAFKGGSRNEFYGYNTKSGTWVTCSLLPYSASGKRKKVNKGGSLSYASSNRQIYALKGGGSFEFWTYRVDSNCWIEKRPMPGDRKRVKGGAGLAYVPSREMVYAFKGGGTCEFYAYDIAHDTWYAKRDIGCAPAPQRLKKVKDGGCLALVCTDSDTVIYALKGGGTREFWAYGVASDTWHYVDSVPYAPSKRNKIRDGAAMAGNRADRLYLFKGGKTVEFWAYDLYAPANPWLSMPGIGGSTLIKSGGALGYGDGMIYALKGNNTREFWRAIEVPSLGIADERERPTENRRQGELAHLTAYPNPFYAKLQIRVPGSALSGSQSAAYIYDAAGRLVRRFDLPRLLLSATYSLIWDGTDQRGRSLPAGIYLIRLAAGTGGTAKVILQR